MADIAQIGFSANTSELSDAKTKMEALVPSAGKAENASKRLAKMFDGVNASADKLMSAAIGLSNAAEKLSAAMNTSAAANNNNEKAMKLAAAAAGKEAAAALTAAAAAAKKEAAINAAANASRKSEAASAAAAAAAQKEAAALSAAATAAGKRSSVPSVGSGSRFNNDIKVQPWGAPEDETKNIQKLYDYAAASTMLASRVQQSAGAMKANVGNIAAQFQDIGVTAAMGMNPLLVALQQGTQLSGVFAQTGGNVFKMLGGAIASVLSPVSLLTIGLVALATAGIQWFIALISKGDEANLTLAEQSKLIQSIASRFGEAAPMLQAYADQLTRIKDATDAMLASEAAAKAQYAGTTQVLSGLNQQYTAMIRSLSGSPEAKVFADKLGVSFGNLRTKLEQGKATADDMKQAQDALAAAMNGAGTPAVIAFGNAFGGIIGQIAAAISAAAGMRKEIGNLAAAANKALNDPSTWRGNRGAQDANNFYNDDRAIQNFSDPQLPMDGPTINFRPSDLDTPKNRGFVKASGGGGKTKKEEYDDIVNGAQRATAAMQAEYDAIGLNAEASARLKYETQLLNEAKQKNINLSPLQRDELLAIAADMAQLETETKKAKEALDFTRDATKGFVSDLASGLREGKSLWESFVNSALNLANKLIDRGLNAIIDKLFEVNTASSGLGGKSSGGGLFGGIAGFIGKLFSGGSTAGVGLYANGGAFANGISAHSNSIVNRPTMFAFASGAGLMGEAGAEAIMPLKRGPDGTLGVQMHDKGGSSQQQVSNNVNVDNHYTIAGAISEKTITEQIRASAEKTVGETKQQLMGWLGEFDRNGIMGTN